MLQTHVTPRPVAQERVQDMYEGQAGYVSRDAVQCDAYGRLWIDPRCRYSRHHADARDCVKIVRRRTHVAIDRRTLPPGVELSLSETPRGLRAVLV